MPIYKQDESGKFVPFEQMPFPELEKEKVLEDWIENNPHLLLEGEDLTIIARQPRTGFDKYLDLLAVDRTGATVVIELKRGETPRDVIAQTLEYASWVDSLTFDQLDDLAREYAQKRGLDANGVADLYLRTFASEPETTEEGRDISERVTFNNRQRLVILAERISDEVEHTLRYLRTRFGADVYGVEFSVHRAGKDTIINTTTVVGREHVSKPAGPSPPREPESDESIMARARTDFVRRAVTAIHSWAAEEGPEGLSVDHSTCSDHVIRYRGSTWIWYYYASSWLFVSLPAATDEEVERLRAGISKPDSVQSRGGGAWRFHVATDGDLEVLKGLILQRVKARREEAGTAMTVRKKLIEVALPLDAINGESKGDVP
jgi:hypothetical protein